MHKISKSFQCHKLFPPPSNSPCLKPDPGHVPVASTNGLTYKGAEDSALDEDSSGGGPEVSGGHGAEVQSVIGAQVTQDSCVSGLHANL